MTLDDLGIEYPADEQADHIGRFIDDLFAAAPSDEWLTLSRKESAPGARVLTDWHQNNAAGRAAFVAHAIDRNASACVWFGAGTRKAEGPPHKRGGSDDVATIPGLWLDIDVADGHHASRQPGALALPDRALAIKLLDAIDPAPSWFIWTGGGFHAWYIFEQPQPAADVADLLTSWGDAWTEIGRSLGVHIDRIVDRARIMRLPATANRKGERLDPPQPARFGEVIVSDGPRHTPADLAAACATVLEQRTPHHSPAPPPPPPPATTLLDAHQRLPRFDDRPSPIDHYNATHPIRDVIADQLGWSMHCGNADAWIRPGSTSGEPSGKILDSGRLFVHSANAHPLQAGDDLDAFDIFTIVEHGGNHAAAVAAAQQLRDVACPPRPVASQSASDTPQNRNDDREPLPPPVGSWGRIDLAEALAAGVPEPKFGELDNGRALLYPARTHVIYGPSEAGKSMVALAIVAQAHEAGHRVAYVDFEDEAASIAERLRGLGVALDSQRLLYVRPEHSMREGVSALQFEQLLEWAPDLVILDGWTETLALEGLNPDVGVDISEWAHLVARPFTTIGAAALIVDHTPKHRGDGAPTEIGSQQKRAILSGASFFCEAIVKPGRADPTGEPIEGRIRLRLMKDRPGHLRGWLRGDSPAAADISITSWPDSGITYLLAAPNSRAGSPSPLAIDIAVYLSMYGEGSKSAISEGVGRDRSDKNVGAELTRMVAAGELEVHPGPRNAKIHTLTDHGRQVHADHLNDGENRHGADQ